MKSGAQLASRVLSEAKRSLAEAPEADLAGAIKESTKIASLLEKARKSPKGAAPFINEARLEFKRLSESMRSIR